MYFYNIIFVVVLIVVLMRYGSRITKLERDFKNLKASPAAVPKVSASVSTSTSVEQTVGATAVLSTPELSQVTAVSQAEKVSSEENTGKILGKVGVFALFLGVTFFLKYAFDNNWIGEVGRVMLGLVSGAVLLGFGQVLRNKYLQYSDLLMGGGIAILYLSTFAAFGFYNLIPASAAFVLMIIITALAFVVSIVNATQTLAVVGVLGGFLTPIFVGSNTDTMLILLSYLTLLNVGILGISIFKKWQTLVYLGFIGTAVNFVAWFSQYYDESRLASAFFFALVTFIIFIAATVVRNVRSKIKANGADFGLLVANAAGFAWLSYIIFEPNYHGFLGFGSVVLAVVYLVIANLANSSNPDDKALNFFLAGTGVVFLTLAVPLQFEGSWITTAWLVESLLIYATASFVSNRSFQVMGATVFIVGLSRFFVMDAFNFNVETFSPIFNKVFGLAVLAILVSYAIAWIYKRYGSVTVELGQRGVMVFVLVANILTVFTLTQQVMVYYQKQILEVNRTYQAELASCQKLNSGFDEGYSKCNLDYSEQAQSTRDLKNTSNTLVSILWALYATILVVLGFARRITSARNLGIILFAITALKIFVDLWSLGELYRIISSIGFGAIALGASFLYAKYKDRLKKSV